MCPAGKTHEETSDADEVLDRLSQGQVLALKVGHHTNRDGEGGDSETNDGVGVAKGKGHPSQWGMTAARTKERTDRQALKVPSLSDRVVHDLANLRSCLYLCTLVGILYRCDRQRT
jgi:hypothetical protein